MQQESWEELKDRFSVYILASRARVCRTYVGYAKDVGHRMRQHGGQLRGGSKTVRGWGTRGFTIVAILSADPAWFTRSVAMQLEAALKRIHTRHRRGLHAADRRLLDLVTLLRQPTWSERSPEPSDVRPLALYLPAGRLSSLYRRLVAQAPIRWTATVSPLVFV